jgi:hypothetical protein
LIHNNHKETDKTIKPLLSLILLVRIRNTLNKRSQIEHLNAAKIFENRRSTVSSQICFNVEYIEIKKIIM